MAKTAAGESLVRRIGETPLLRLRSCERETPGCELWAKAEWYNPGGSVKDRAAGSIVSQALQSAELAHPKRLLDASSGNTGISYAMLGAVFGFGVTLVVPANAGHERQKIMRTYGAELILTDPMQGMDLATRTARELWARNPAAYFYADQYSNDANWRAHDEGTGREILRQTQHRVTHFVAGLGTSGTFMGVTRRLRREKPGVRCVAFIPDSPYHGLEGLKHMPTACVPSIYDPRAADTVLQVSTEEAQETVLALAHTEGVLVGFSAGAAVAATRRLMRQEGPGVYVTLLPDSGLKYLSDPLFDREPTRSCRVGGEP